MPLLTARLAVGRYVRGIASQPVTVDHLGRAVRSVVSRSQTASSASLTSGSFEWVDI